MKKALLLVMGFAAYGLQAQVGINTTDPQSTLDVNGDLRIQNTPATTVTNYSDCPCLLVIGNDGVVRRVTVQGLGLSSGSGGNPPNGGGGSGANLGGEATANFESQTNYVISFTYNTTTIDGKIDNNQHKVKVKIPYTNGNGKSYNQGTVTVQTTAESAKNGTPSSITMKINEGSLNNGSGYIDAEITTPQEYLVKLLAPGVDVKVAEFPFTLGGVTRTVTLKAIGGIPDRKFGEPDGKHNFLYLPVEVTGPGYSETWLNYNLGADYAKVGSSDFNLMIKKHGQQAHIDDKLYGSYYQWQRPTDGHEFKNSSTTDTQATNWSATQPNGIKHKFITSEFSWISYGGGGPSEGNRKLWQKDGANNPCPVGYHVPTEAEWKAFHKLITNSNNSVSNNKMWVQNKLPNLAAAGWRGAGGPNYKPREYGRYWSSSYYNNPSMLTFIANSSYLGTDVVSVGNNVRCLKDK